MAESLEVLLARLEERQEATHTMLVAMRADLVSRHEHNAVRADVERIQGHFTLLGRTVVGTIVAGVLGFLGYAGATK